MTFLNKAKSVDVEDLLEKVERRLKRMEIIETNIMGVNKLSFKNPIFPNMLRITSSNFITRFKFAYEPDLSFTERQKHIHGEEIQYQEILNNCRHNMITGGAGAGKTTLIRFYAKHGKEIWPQIKIIVYLEFRTMFSNETYRLEDVILGADICPELDIGEDRKKLLRWMIENQEAVLFTVDGYDQLTTPFDKKKYCQLSYSSTGSKSDFIRCIINSSLFGDSKVITSSREHAIRELPKDCMPEAITQLAGFSVENIDKIVIDLSDASVLNHLKSKNVVLYTLCAQPLYTSLVSAVYKINPVNPPDSLTGVLMFLVSNFIRSDNIRGNTRKSFDQLIHLAYTGTEKRRVIFTVDDLEKHKITKKDIEDFCTMLPSSLDTNVVINNILEGGYTINFVHQNFQEFFTALYAVSSNLPKFRKFVCVIAKDVCRGNWILVHRMVLGIVCQTQVGKQLQELYECKKQIFIM